MIPTVFIVPPLMAAFMVLAFDHYQLNPIKPVRNIRFIMMVGAIILMFVQILLSGLSPWISLAILVLAAFWLGSACLMFWRRASAG